MKAGGFCGRKLDSPPATRTVPSVRRRAVWPTRGKFIGATKVHAGSTSAACPCVSTNISIRWPRTVSRTGALLPSARNAVGAVTLSARRPLSSVIAIVAPCCTGVAPATSQIAAGRPLVTAPGSKTNHSSAPPDVVVQYDLPPGTSYVTARRSICPSPASATSRTRISPLFFEANKIGSAPFLGRTTCPIGRAGARPVTIASKPRSVRAIWAPRSSTARA